MYRIGRDVDLRGGAAAEWAITIGARSGSRRALRGAAGLARTSTPPFRTGRGRAARRGHRPRHRPDLARVRSRSAGRRRSPPTASRPSASTPPRSSRVEAGRPRFGYRDDQAGRSRRRPGSTSARSASPKGYSVRRPSPGLHYKGKPNSASARIAANDGREHRSADSLMARDRDVGTAVLSPALGPIALAIVRREASPGDEVTVGEGIRAPSSNCPSSAERLRDPAAAGGLG